MDKRIDEIETVEDLTGTSFFVYLKPGWRLEDAHCFGEDTKRAIRDTMKRVKPCDCESCTESA